jgi:predicted dienelactone hydrolase
VDKADLPTILLWALLLAPAQVCRAQRFPPSLWTVESPTPSGPDQVGTLSVQLMDERRTDPYLANGANRELVVRFWYPALAQLCQQAEYNSARVWSYISHLSGSPLPAVKTHSCANATATGGFHPVIIFTHGYTGTLTDDTFLFEDLASRGFIVASIAHTHETTVVEFTDGRLVKSVLGSYMAGNLRLDQSTLQRARLVRLADISFVLNTLQQMNSASGGPLAGRLNFSQIGVMGHSLGGK